MLIGALALLAVAGVVVLLLVLTSSGGGSSSSSSANSAVSSSSAPRSHHGRVAAVNPGNVTVAVLNGTATSGLAHRVALKLTGQGFKQGMVTTATDQTRTTTTIAYLPGHRRAAQAVAAVLKLSPGSVAAVDQNTQAVACPPPAACTATVIVTVGADLASVQ